MVDKPDSNIPRVITIDVSQYQGPEHIYLKLVGRPDGAIKQSEYAAPPTPPTETVIPEVVETAAVSDAAPAQNPSLEARVETQAPAVHATKSDKNEFVQLYPSLKENLEDHYPIKGAVVKIAKEFGFRKQLTAGVDDIIRLAAYEAQTHDDEGELEFSSPEQIPDARVHQVRQKLIPYVQQESELQDLVNSISWIDGKMRFVAQGEQGFALYGFRSSGESKVTTPFDKIVQAEDIVYAAEIAYAIWKLSGIKPDGVGRISSIGDVMRNRFIDTQLRYIAGIGIALPLAADIIQRGHPLDKVGKMLPEKIGEFFHIAPGSTQGSRSAETTSMALDHVKNVAMQYAPDGANLVHQVEKIRQTPGHAVIHSLSHLFGKEAEVLSSSGALLMRLLHGEIVKHPFMSQYTAEAGVYHAAQLTYREMYGGKK